MDGSGREKSCELTFRQELTKQNRCDDSAVATSVMHGTHRIVSCQDGQTAPGSVKENPSARSKILRYFDFADGLMSKKGFPLYGSVLGTISKISAVPFR